MVWAFTIVKSMLLTPIPSARTATAENAKPGARHNIRIASRRSCSVVSTSGSPRWSWASFLDARDAAEGPPRRAPRLVFVQPERHLLCGQQVQVCLDLFRQPLVPTTAQDEIEGSREKYPDAGHDSPSRRRLTIETVRAQSSVSDASWRRPEAVIE